jgi:hypothetical protein
MTQGQVCLGLGRPCPLWAPAADSGSGARLHRHEGGGNDAAAHPRLAGEVVLARDGPAAADFTMGTSGTCRENGNAGGDMSHPRPIPLGRRMREARRSS